MIEQPDEQLSQLLEQLIKDELFPDGIFATVPVVPVGATMVTGTRIQMTAWDGTALAMIPFAIVNIDNGHFNLHYNGIPGWQGAATDSAFFGMRRRLFDLLRQAQMAAEIAANAATIATECKCLEGGSCGTIK